MYNKTVETRLTPENPQHKCAVCQETFTSRTKLFDHIKALDHAERIPVSNAKAGKKKRR